MVIIAMPTHGMMQAATAADFAYLMRHSPDTEWAIGYGTYVQNNRTNLVHTAVKGKHDSGLKATHILFIDSDMRFPKDTLERLLAHKKDIIGANARSRTEDVWVARKDEKFISSVGKKGIEEVDTLGFGIILIDLKVFTSKLRGLPPNCFAQPFNTFNGNFVGEDIYFCTIAREKGWKIWVDHDLSQEVKHIGQVEL